MRTLLLLIVLVVLAGGGYYWYTENMAAPMDHEMTEPFGATNTNTNQMPGATTNTGPQGANMPTDTQNDTGGTSSAGAGEETTPGAASTASVKEFTVSGENFKFTPSTMTVERGDTVRITFNNVGGTHDLRVDGYEVGTKVIQGGTSETFEFVANEAGSFEYYCSVGQHRQMGMVGTLTVTN